MTVQDISITDRLGDELPRALVREDSAAADATEIRHYVRIYAELLSLEQDLLQRGLGSGSNGVPEAAADDVADLQAEVERLQARLSYWEKRLAEVRGIGLDEENRVLTHRNVSVSLTRRELQLLACLMRNPDGYLTSRRLIQKAWNAEPLAEEQVRSYIVRLRRKLETARVPCRLVNSPRQGYQLRFDQAPA